MRQPTHLIAVSSEAVELLVQARTLDLVIDQHLLVIGFPEPPDRRRENHRLGKGLGLTRFIEARLTPDEEDRLVGSGRCRVHVRMAKESHTLTSTELSLRGLSARPNQSPFAEGCVTATELSR